MHPKSLNKVHKQMKKKGAKTNALHENSRDAKKLRRAGAREAKLARLVTATVKANQIYSEIKSFALVMADHDEEVDRKARYQGRPPSNQEDRLSHQIDEEQKEYASGLWIPDLRNRDCMATVRRWDQQWASLNQMTFQKFQDPFENYFSIPNSMSSSMDYEISPPSPGLRRRSIPTRSLDEELSDFEFIPSKSPSQESELEHSNTDSEILSPKNTTGVSGQRLSLDVSFSIADLNNAETDPDNVEDEALDDELEDEQDVTPQSRGARSKGAINQGRTDDGNFNVAPEDAVAPADRDEATGSAPAPAFATRVSVTIKKPGKGAIQLECIASDGYIELDNVYHFRSSEMADASTAEKDFSRQNIYAGPPFANLDEDLQIMFERYISERGIDERLAQFIPDYTEFKEQKEYVQWLDGVKSFVES
ncbi:MAG: hypothetical protein Q9227_001406 [Pyrenula ochraceoflavens]